VSVPPDSFTLHVGGVSYFVYRVPSSGAVRPQSDVGPLWAFRPEGSTGVSHSLPVVTGERYTALKARILQYLSPNGQAADGA
jgi:hypothetical protein